MFTKLFYKGLAHQLSGASVTTTIKTYRNTTEVISNLIPYATDFWKSIGNPCTYAKTETGIPNCVVFGFGDTPPALDDYCLSGEHLTTANITVSRIISDSFDTSTATYTITNTGSDAVTIKEAGVITQCTSWVNGALVWREVLDTPVTIEPGGVGQVTLTFNVNIPS